MIKIKDGAAKLSFNAPELQGEEFELFPVTKFIYGHLPVTAQAQELEYAWMTGAALDAYELWAKENATSMAWNSLEMEFVALLSRLNFWAVMFAPEGDRLGEFVSARAENVVRMLRRGVSDMAACEGFPAFSP